MKKNIYIILILAFGLFSCYNKEANLNDVPADCIMLNVFNSPMTKAVDPNGAEYERELKRLDCFFYVKGATDQPCVYYQKINLDKIGSAEIPFYVDEATINSIFPSGNTTCDVFVLANLPDGTYSNGLSGTDVNTLSKRVLELGNNYDAVDKPFIMAGLDEATKGDYNNATGIIPLYRAAAKITVTVNIPEKIIIKQDGAADVVMAPVFSDNNNLTTLKTSFNNGAKKTNIESSYIINNEVDLFSTDKKNYSFITEIPATQNELKKYQYKCTVPFYTYARAWDKGSNNAAYLTFEIPWANVTDENNVSYQKYYYQILVNANERNFEPNHWYDLTVNVGVLGSTVEAEPKTIHDITYYILDWTTEPDPEHEAGGDRYENVDIQKYTYLQIPEKNIVINNASSGVIRFSASHNIKIKFNTGDKYVSYLPAVNNKNKTNFAAYYVFCGPDSSGNTQEPEIRELPNFTISNFDINQEGVITYNYTIPESIYSPVYIYATVWLDINNNNQLDDTEEDFVEEITIVQYPPIYVIPDLTTRYSIYVNNIFRTGDGSGDLVRYPQTGNSYYGLGLVPGTNSTTGANPTYMYVVTVSSLKSSDVFYYNKDNDMNGTKTPYKYIIGDPRQRTSDTDLNDDGYDMDQHWVVAPDVNGTQRKLQYYYPTSVEDDNFQVIAPKFRIVSFHGNGHRYHNYEGAKMRCASYQEDGYPAGRWRLPTYAELQFVIKLQEERVISPIFFGSSKYFTATNQVTYNANGSTYMDFQDNSPGTINGSNGSVRCIYDEWYWGSEREAKENTTANPPAGEEYLFTWGDKKIW